MGLFSRKPKTPPAPPTREQLLAQCRYAPGTEPDPNTREGVARDEHHQREIATLAGLDVDGWYLFTLRPEQSNTYDKNAIAVYCNGKRIGYTSMAPSTQAKASSRLRNHLGGALHVVGELSNGYNGRVQAWYYLPKGTLR